MLTYCVYFILLNEWLKINIDHITKLNSIIWIYTICTILWNNRKIKFNLKVQQVI